MTIEDGGEARGSGLDRFAPAFIVLFNLAPLAGVLWLGWRADVLLLLYWAENVIVGLFAAARIVVSGAVRGPATGFGSVFLAAFFCLHYGLFCAGHLFFLTLMFVADPQGDLPFAQAFALLNSPGVLWSLAALGLLQLYDTAAWLFRGGPRTSEPKAEMSRPYPRMVVLHLTIIAAGFAVMGLGQPVWAVVILAGLKTAFDLWNDRRSARKRRRGADATLVGTAA